MPTLIRKSINGRSRPAVLVVTALVVVLISYLAISSVGTGDKPISRDDEPSPARDPASARSATAVDSVGAASEPDPIEPRGAGTLDIMRPGAPRPGIAAGPVAQAVGAPLEPRISADLQTALAGNATLAADLARDLMVCEAFFAKLAASDAKAVAAESVGLPEAEIANLEDQTLGILSDGVAPKLCKGVTAAHLGSIDALLSIAVRGSELRSLPGFMERQTSREKLLEFLADPVAASRFRDAVLPALQNGQRQCDYGSIVALADLHRRGLFVARSASRTLALELMAAWISDADPSGSPVIGELLATLSPTETQAGIESARRMFGQHCR